MSGRGKGLSFPDFLFFAGRRWYNGQKLTEVAFLW